VRGRGVVYNGNFQRAFLMVIFSDTLEIRPPLLDGFSVIPKCMTLNDLDWLFRVRFCFRAGLAFWLSKTIAY